METKKEKVIFESMSNDKQSLKVIEERELLVIMFRDPLGYEVKFDLLKSMNFSKATESQIDKLLNNNSFDEICKPVIEEMSKQYRKELSKAVIKSAFLKASLYDKECNPCIAGEYERNRKVRKFCHWFLQHIKDEELTKEQIIEDLEIYAEDK